MQCKTADELIALAKVEGFDITKAEAEAYMVELADVELDNETLKNVAGGVCWDYCVGPYGECDHEIKCFSNY